MVTRPASLQSERPDAHDERDPKGTFAETLSLDRLIRLGVMYRNGCGFELF